MPVLDVSAYAKLNLSLDVLDRRPDGYHDMRMVMQTVDLRDAIRLETGTGKPLSMGSDLGFLPADGRNLAAAAALKLAEEAGLDYGGLAIALEEGFRQSVEYYPRPNIRKQVVYFLGSAGEGRTHRQEEEISEIRWVPLKSAHREVTFRNDKNLISHAKKYLRRKFSRRGERPGALRQEQPPHQIGE